jgi:hypothetical protein
MPGAARLYQQVAHRAVAVFSSRPDCVDQKATAGRLGVNFVLVEREREGYRSQFKRTQPQRLGPGKCARESERDLIEICHSGRRVPWCAERGQYLGLEALLTWLPSHLQG